MLRTLLESTQGRTRNKAGALGSIATHVGLIAAAAYATAAGAPPAVQQEANEKLIWFNTAQRSVSPSLHPSRSAARPATRQSSLPASVGVQIDIPSSLPEMSVSLGNLVTLDFSSYAARAAGALADSIGGEVSPVGIRSYSASEVETPVAALRGTGQPDYPPALRSSGLEGHVTAQFVVDETGRARAETLRILSATNDLFSESVLRALAKMRFRPARIGDRPVPQIVQQMFVFRLDQ